MTSTQQPPYRMRWWGWGVDGNDSPITPDAEEMLVQKIGMDVTAHHPLPNIAEVHLPDSRLLSDDISALQEAVPNGTVSVEHDTRLKHALGRSYPDLARLRAGVIDIAPDAVVAATTEQELIDLLKVCTERGIAVITFGGGTSVVGGVEAYDGGFGKAIALSMVNFNKILGIDTEAETVEVQAGVFGPDLEAALQPLGLTVGHFPQSFEFSTVGGWMACRSSGQESSGYGRIDRNVIGMRVITPAGVIDLRDMPSTAAGPDPRELFLGAEGTLGIILSATIQLHRTDGKMVFDTYFFDSFEEGADTFRELKQSGHIPHLARLSDEPETAFGIAQLSGSLGQKLDKYFELRKVKQPCMAIFGFGGTNKIAARAEREALAARLLGKKCIRLGPTAGNMWVKHRFTSPYLRDVMMERRVAVDTLETATTWDNAVTLRTEIVRAMEAAAEKHGSPVFVLCHISHMYASGCSLYFTYFFREEPGKVLEQWADIKTAAGDAMMAHGGTITHHHGVGQDHAPQFFTETSQLYARVLMAAKLELDPAGILNPGKLAAGPETLADRYRLDSI